MVYRTSIKASILYRRISPELIGFRTRPSGTLSNVEALEDIDEPGTRSLCWSTTGKPVDERVATDSIASGSSVIGGLVVKLVEAGFGIDSVDGFSTSKA